MQTLTSNDTISSHGDLEDDPSDYKTDPVEIAGQAITESDASIKYNDANRSIEMFHSV